MRFGWPPHVTEALDPTFVEELLANLDGQRAATRKPARPREEVHRVKGGTIRRIYT